MRVIVVGAGPVGIFCGLSLSRDGHQVTIVDRDAPPPDQGQWPRRGVMQFNLPHFFRSILRQSLLESLPDVWEAVVAGGGIPYDETGPRRNRPGCNAAGPPSSAPLGLWPHGNRPWRCARGTRSGS